jgi:hypothetical protein
MVRYKIPLILQCLTLLIPLNIYMWGNWILVNLQWAFFRYQYTAEGSGFFPGNKDVTFVLLGFTSGIHNVLAVYAWAAGSILLLAGVLITVYACLREDAARIRIASFFTIGAGILFGISAVERFFSGFAIPLGLPVLFAIAWITYRQQPEPDEVTDSDKNTIDPKTAPDRE